jgi:CheY-specific phosphatase CheX
MPDSSNLREHLEQAVSSVFETMCFATVSARESREERTGEFLCVEVPFRGPMLGRLVFAASGDVARSLAPDFLGIDPGTESPSSVQEVLAELTNMVCGAALSRMEPNTIFHLSTPAFISSVPVFDDGLGAQQTFDLDCGPIVVQFHVLQCNVVHSITVGV